MPKYVILGATGSTGAEIVKVLRNRPEIDLHVYARSVPKLEKLHPGISSAKNVTIYTGSITDTQTLEPCLSGSDVIFQTVAQNVNEPGCSVAQQSAQSIVSTLEGLKKAAAREGKEFAAPKVVFLSSGSLDEHAVAQQGWLWHTLIYNAVFYVYEDVRLATEYIRREAPWLPLIRAAPGGITNSERVGVKLGKDGEVSQTISYPDLADGMILMAEDDACVGKSVTLVSLGKPRGDLLLPSIFRYLIPGSIVSLVPAIFPLFKKIGIS